MAVTKNRRTAPEADSDFDPDAPGIYKSHLVDFIYLIDPHAQIPHKTKVGELREWARDLIQKNRETKTNTVARSPSRPSKRNPIRIPDSPDPSPAQSPAQTTRSPARTVQSPARTARSPARTARSPARTARSPARTARSPARTARSPARTARSPARTARSPARTARSPVRTARSPIRTARSPGRAARSPARTARSPVRTARSPARASRQKLPRSSSSSPSPRKPPTRRRSSVQLSKRHPVSQELISPPHEPAPPRGRSPGRSSHHQTSRSSLSPSSKRASHKPVPPASAKRARSRSQVPSMVAKKKPKSRQVTFAKSQPKRFTRTYASPSSAHGSASPTESEPSPNESELSPTQSEGESSDLTPVQSDNNLDSEDDVDAAVDDYQVKTKRITKSRAPRPVAPKTARKTKRTQTIAAPTLARTRSKSPVPSSRRRLSVQPLKSIVKKPKVPVIEIDSGLDDYDEYEHAHHTRSGYYPKRSPSFDDNIHKIHHVPRSADPDALYYAEEGRHHASGSRPPISSYLESEQLENDFHGDTTHRSQLLCNRRRYVRLPGENELTPRIHRVYKEDPSEWRFTPAPIPFASTSTTSHPSSTASRSPQPSSSQPNQQSYWPQANLQSNVNASLHGYQSTLASRGHPPQSTHGQYQPHPPSNPYQPQPPSNPYQPQPPPNPYQPQPTHHGYQPQPTHHGYQPEVSGQGYVPLNASQSLQTSSSHRNFTPTFGYPTQRSDHQPNHSQQLNSSPFPAPAHASYAPLAFGQPTNALGSNYQAQFQPHTSQSSFNFNFPQQYATSQYEPRTYNTTNVNALRPQPPNVNAPPQPPSNVNVPPLQPSNVNTSPLQSSNVNPPPLHPYQPPGPPKPFDFSEYWKNKKGASQTDQTETNNGEDSSQNKKFKALPSRPSEPSVATAFNQQQNGCPPTSNALQTAPLQNKNQQTLTISGSNSCLTSSTPFSFNPRSSIFGTSNTQATTNNNPGPSIPSAQTTQPTTNNPFMATTNNSHVSTASLSGSQKPKTTFAFLDSKAPSPANNSPAERNNDPPAERNQGNEPSLSVAAQALMDSAPRILADFLGDNQNKIDPMLISGQAPENPPLRPTQTNSSAAVPSLPPPQSAPVPKPGSVPLPHSTVPPQPALPPTKSTPPSTKSIPPPTKSSPPPTKSIPPPPKSISPPAYTQSIPPPTKSMPPPPKSSQSVPPPPKSVPPPPKSITAPPKSVPPPKKSVVPPSKSSSPPLKSSLSTPPSATVDKGCLDGGSSTPSNRDKEDEAFVNLPV